MYNNALELYNVYLEIYVNQYMALSDAEKRKLGDKYDPENLFLIGYDYSVCQKTNKNRLINKNL